VTAAIQRDNDAGRRGAGCRILMLLENESYPDDTRVALECRCLCDAGYEVSVICPTGVSRRRYEFVHGVRVYRYPKPWELPGFAGYVWEYGYSLTLTFWLSLYVLARHGFDVVHAHTPPDMFVLLGQFYKLLGKRFVMDHHDLSPELYQARHGGKGSKFVFSVLCWFERLACRTADRVIATNETQRGIGIRRGGASPDFCHVVRNGPDARFLQPVRPLSSLAKDGRVVIGYVGMIGVQDGVDQLLRALHWLKDRLKRDDFCAVVVGAGPSLADMKQLANVLGIQQLVHFAGYRVGKDLLRHIASFDICVTPDPSNPYNDSCTTVKSMEYMAMAKPVVAFDLPENRLTLGGAALYARGNDVRELAMLMEQLIDRPDERVRLGQLGRERIVDYFSWEQQADNLLDVYDALLGRAAKRPPAADRPEDCGAEVQIRHTAAAPAAGSQRNESCLSAESVS
jgi:glycosyltransferase involved in cell wall biosynthesis